VLHVHVSDPRAYVQEGSGGRCHKKRLCHVQIIKRRDINYSVLHILKHIQKLFGAYHRLLYAHPICTQAVQSSILLGIGDIISQAIIEGKEIKNIDKGRKCYCL
jgi:hypothetical protein